MRTDDHAKHHFIDALRGIAVLLVILTHTAQPVQGLSAGVDALAKYGQTGVQLFFVASAYTLCLSFARRGGEPRPLLAFYLRRFFRIAPLYYTGIAVYCVLHLALQPGPARALEPYTAANVLANLLFLHGFVPAANNVIVPGGWSIGTEMAFYALFPLLYVAGLRIAQRSLAALAGAVLLLIAGNLLLQTLVLADTPYAMAGNSFGYFNIVNQLPVFALGMLVYMANEVQRRPPWPAWVNALALLGCTLLTLWLWRLRVPLLWAVIPVSAALSFCGLLQLLRAARRLPASLCRIGSVSYSMYVFHFLFAWYAVPALLAPLQSKLTPEVQLLLSLVLVVAGTFALALLSERWIEARGIALGRRLIRRLQPTATARPASGVR